MGGFYYCNFTAVVFCSKATLLLAVSSLSYRASFHRRSGRRLDVVFASRLAVKRQFNALDSLPEIINLGIKALQLPGKHVPDAEDQIEYAKAVGGG